MQSSKKRVKIFGYIRNKVALERILFLQETHSSVETENNGMTNLRVNYISLTVAPIHVVFLLNFMETLML